MNTVPPTRPEQLRLKSPEFGLHVLDAGGAVVKALLRAENTSGAPFAKANKVTPAKDYEKPVHSVKYSIALARYSSAVSYSIYMNTKPKNMTKGTNTTVAIVSFMLSNILQ